MAKATHRHRKHGFPVEATVLYVNSRTDDIPGWLQKAVVDNPSLLRQQRISWYVRLPAGTVITLDEAHFDRIYEDAR